jgi:hypothetical protein
VSAVRRLPAADERGARPDDHLWTKPEEKRPEGVTHLMIIFVGAVIT